MAKTFYLPRVSFEVALLLKHYVNGNPIAYGSNNYSDENQLFRRGISALLIYQGQVIPVKG